MVSFFVKFVRICFSLCEGFNVSTIKDKLVPINSEKTEYHLMNLAFKQHIHKVLENEEIREMLVTLVNDENVTNNEMKFLENYPVLHNACMKKMSRPWLEWVNFILTCPEGFSVDFRNVDDARTLPEFDGIDNFDWDGSVLTIRSRQMGADQITQGIELSNRSEREEAIIGRRQPKPSKKLKKREPVTFPKSSSKSYYNYSNPKKYNKSGRF
ncbi:hypothetical protein CAEBREN_01332 [Caenorhabditis brenneri]|uniref:SPK domain-containing protein n=1 Tax=Caenorhabditis brenneri TaxID=135651 RepID=G0NQU1_CAEBE|nr:hypothetical protein CAEBREN_01332 [Caenorhabditis brenneri]